MDQYTQITRDWLNERFKKTDERGVYIAHQPIYGYNKGAHEPNVLARLSRTYQIMRVLNTLSFDSFLDVGAAEGYCASLVRDVFGVDVAAFDLSREAGKRARELYYLDTVAGDIHHLPFADNSFDVVYCSETIEHVTNPQQAISELIRVARRAVLVTTPREAVASSLSQEGGHEPHGHIHTFDVSVFTKLFPQGTDIIPLRFHSLLYLMVAVEGPELPEHVARLYHKNIVRLYALWRPVAHLLFRSWIAEQIVRLDAWLTRLFPKRSCDLLALYRKDDEVVRMPVSDQSIRECIFKKHILHPKSLAQYRHMAPQAQYSLTQLVCQNCGKQLVGDERGYKCTWCHQRHEGEDGVVDVG